ncbi:MAG: tetratricopeptide repeat protein [Gemmatimonadota bacterium]
MPDVAKLKKKAAEFELKKQFDKALAVYVEILDGYDPSDEEVDVSLFNRVGDLYLKQGSVGDAVDYYEQAVDRYADGGFHNNAIALCNKILRNSPGRASVYYKLGKISAQKGFKGDAKKNFLEYADRMQTAGKIDEAFRALKEFADLCPDQDDIRLMLADQLSKKGLGSEAIEQLQLLYVRYSHEGRDAEARATVERMKAIDPTAEPRALGDAPSRSAADLVFLDLNDSGPSPRVSAAHKKAMLGLELMDTSPAPAPPRRPTPAPPPAIVAPPPIVAPTPTPAVAHSPVPSIEILETPELDASVLDGVTRVAEFEQSGASEPSGGLLEGLEATSFAAHEAPSGSILDLEPTSFTPDVIDVVAPPPAADIPDLLDFDLPIDVPANTASSTASIDDIAFDLPEFEEPAPPPRRTARPSLVGLPMLVDEEGEEPPADDDGSSIGGDLELIMPEGTPARGAPAVSDKSSELSFMDLGLPAAGEAAASISGAPSRNSMEFLTPASDALDAGELVDDFSIDEPPPVRRQSTMVAEQSVDFLQALSEADPDDNRLRRRLAEAMLESGDREGGLRELEAAMVGYERAEDLSAAAQVADEIVLLNPASVRHHQKRVEYAFRLNERGRLIEAYLQLADALFRAGQVDKSRAIYQRVIDLSPDDPRAAIALQTFPPPEPPPEAPAAPTKGRSTTPQQRVSVPTPAKSMPAITPDDEYVNLGDWLRDDAGPKDTRMVVDEQEPSGDEAADFADMLKKFKQGISENVEDEDHQSHYDLGVAYKEMGLLDEAIAEFQKALRAPSNRVPTYEALGLCFIEKEQYPMAATILSRAVHEPGMKDDQLVGVLYLMGVCAEQRGQRDAAIEYYQRVFVVDITFRDVGERLVAVENSAP